MIRRFVDNDINEVMTVWISVNIESHSFISEDYWRNKFDYVSSEIPMAEVFVSEEEGKINGFIGIVENYIAGIFVSSESRLKGIGTELLDIAKKEREELNLKVYKNNIKAVIFYQKTGFEIVREEIDDETSEMEYVMIWHR